MRKTRKIRGGNSNIQIRYNTNIMNNSFKTKESTSIKPNIKLLNIPLSTMIMYDPDAIVPEYVHYLVTNIVNGDITTGTTVLSYMGPAPPSGSGIHRYIFEQLQQVSPINILLSDRSNFSIQNFKQTYGLETRASKKFKVKS